MLTGWTAHLLHSSLAPSTRKAYQLGLQTFTTFRISAGLTPSWPAPPYHVRNFLAFLANKGTSPSTATTYLAGISFLHKLNNWEDPSKDFQCQKMLIGLKKLGSRLPLTLEMLKSILTHLPRACPSAYECQLFTAAFLTCFFGLLRVGELSAPNRSTPSPLLLSHLSFSPNLHVTLLLTRSKTDQFKKGHRIKLKPSPDPQLCPCRALHRYITLFRTSRQGPLFMHSDTSPLTSFQFTSVLKHSAAHAGIPTQHLSSHSFRIGACSSALNLGLSVKDIKQLGRWSSKAFQSYIRI